MDYLPTNEPIAKVWQRELSPAALVGNIVPALNPSEYETITGLLGILQRRWQLAASVLAGTAFLGLLICLLMTPVYSSTATLAISAENPTEATASRSAYNADELKSELQTDMGILETDGMAVSVVKALDLGNKKPFLSAIDRSEKGRPIDDAPRTREQIVKLFKNSIKVTSPVDTRLIAITAKNPDPVVAAQMANALANTFIQESLDRQHNSTTESSFWLQKELADLKSKVQDSEQKLADYESKTGLAGVQLTGSATADGGSSVAVSPHNPVTERLFTLGQELTAAEANRISTETVYHLVKSQNPEVVLGLGSMSVSNAGGAGGTGAITADSGIELVRSFRAQEAALNREYAGYAVKYGTNNPRLTDLQQQISAVQQQMQGELQRISKRAENAYLYARKNEDTIRQQFTTQQAEANELNGKMVQLQVLGQEAYSNRALYESFYSKLQTANLAAGTRPSRFTLINMATRPGSPSSPNFPKYMAAAVGAGLIFGIIAVFLRESLDETVRTPRDLGALPRSVVLAHIPTDKQPGLMIAGAKESRLIEFPTSPFSEAFRSLRTSIISSDGHQRVQKLLITSAIAGDGKTTVVYNLGIAFAQQGARVLIIDCDMRHPDLHNQFNVPRSPGLSDLIGDDARMDLSAIVPHPKLPKLSFLPAGEQPELAAELLGSSRFGALLQTCGSRYDYVLIDSPPILPVTDAAIIANKVDGVIAVVRSRRTTRTLLSGLVHALQRTKTPVLGFVLNDVRDATADGMYAYSYTGSSGSEVQANA